METGKTNNALLVMKGILWDKDITKKTKEQIFNTIVKKHSDILFRNLKVTEV